MIESTPTSSQAVIDEAAAAGATIAEQNALARTLTGRVVVAATERKTRKTVAGPVELPLNRAERRAQRAWRRKPGAPRMTPLTRRELQQITVDKYRELAAASKEASR